MATMSATDDSDDDNEVDLAGLFRARPIPRKNFKGQPFGKEVWLECLLELNPWAKDHIIAEDDLEFRAARREQTLVRWKEGVESWSLWAEAMADLHDAAAQAGWLSGSDEFDWKPFDTVEQAHFALAVADFSGHSFKSHNAGFENILFPGAAEFRNAQFGSEAAPAKADFTMAIFYGPVSFNQAVFFDNALFELATFYGRAWFAGTTFQKLARFSSAYFAIGAFFQRANFKGSASFDSSGFGRKLDRPAANFKGSKFEGSASFSRAEFDGSVSFDSVQSEVSFSLAGACFKRTPSFIEAKFHDTPRLDTCRSGNRQYRGGQSRPTACGTQALRLGAGRT
jgi:uncharacterized protein YjbI with pentapeptide repeats